LAGGAIASSLPEHVKKAINTAKNEFKAAGSKGIIVTGLQDVPSQTKALELNANSEVIDVAAPRLTRSGDTREVTQLVKDMKAGNVGMLIMAGVNPSYTLPDATAFDEGLAKVGVTVACSMRADETASKATHIAPTPHYLEAWGDVQIKQGEVSITQPTIRPLFDTRQFQDSLLTWMGADQSYYDYLKTTMSAAGISFNKAVHDGVVMTNAFAKAETTTTEASITEDAGLSSSSVQENGGYELTLYTKTSMGDGNQANNPWLQEMPDPITRATWDNYITMSEADAKKEGLWLDRSTFFTEGRHNANGGLNGTLAKITVNGVEVIAPVMVQPGQANGSIGLALGYGRTTSIQKDMQTGVNAYPLMQNFSATQDVTIEKVAGVHEFAVIQLHNTLMGRGDIVKETRLEIFNTKDKGVWNAVPQVSKNHTEYDVTSPEVDLWDEFDRSIGHHFNLGIDLNACTGCGACVIACHAENNVPVVGKSEVRRSRDMHWLRIDRYYSSNERFSEDNQQKDDVDGLGLSDAVFGEGQGDGALSSFGRMEDPSANPQVAFQPVMCQHCNHAPCETVCPVAATSHGRQGQNHMAYNRCVGTRYCANNCPYKVRRFNWFLYNGNDEFDYFMNNDLGRMVINPDVTVRSRGVMEKCSMCIQMTQKTILDAKREGREVKDGEFATACSNACTSGALTFGDVNDTSSDVYHESQDDRMYHLLESVGTKPNVFYQTKVRNTKEA
jgi:molybdopterin-containing oxidoreductase family iron-sulfur binding subunit